MADGYLATQLLYVAAKLGVADVMPPAARLLIVDAVLPDRARDLPAAIRMDLLMLLLLNARERTTPEFGALLSAAGFQLRRVVPTDSPTGLAVIEARPV
jgi:O-methyltransferase domain